MTTCPARPLDSAGHSLAPLGMTGGRARTPRRSRSPARTRTRTSTPTKSRTRPRSQTRSRTRARARSRTPTVAFHTDRASGVEQPSDLSSLRPKSRGHAHSLPPFAILAIFARGLFSHRHPARNTSRKARKGREEEGSLLPILPSSRAERGPHLFCHPERSGATPREVEGSPRQALGLWNLCPPREGGSPHPPGLGPRPLRSGPPGRSAGRPRASFRAPVPPAAGPFLGRGG